MTAIRSVRAAEGKFVQLANAAGQDPRLSLTARGIIYFILSLPPDQHLTAEWLETRVPDSRRSVRAALRELEACGYYRKSRRSGGKGTWIWEQVISDAPIETASEQADSEGAFPQVVSSDRFTSDENTSDENRPDKNINTEDPKDVGPVDMASRRARAKAASANLTVQDAIDAVRRAATIEHGADEGNGLTDSEALGLFFTYVGAKRPRDLVAYLGKIFADAPYLDTFLANSEGACTRCQKWESICTCPAA